MHTADPMSIFINRTHISVERFKGDRKTWHKYHIVSYTLPHHCSYYLRIHTHTHKTHSTARTSTSLMSSYSKLIYISKSYMHCAQQLWIHYFFTHEQKKVHPFSATQNYLKCIISSVFMQVSFFIYDHILYTRTLFPNTMNLSLPL